MFNKVSIDLGNIQPESKHNLSFDYDQNTVMVTRITTPCDCTEASNSITERAVKAVYAAPPFPVHLQRDGVKEMKVDKVIEVYFNDTEGTLQHQTLHFTANIVI